HDMLTTQESGIMQYVPDYRINLISPVSMNDQEIEKFKSDFKQLAKFIQCGKDKNAMKKLVESRL
ncbi:MAG: transposase, partial [Lachnospiraceae bacterium]|nr:transposase [Lachnospiraceae bacterium]